MVKFLLLPLLLCVCFSAQAQYIETFSTTAKGYKLSCANDFSGLNWSLSVWDAAGTCQTSDPRDPTDYFNTTAAGKLESIDLDQEVYWESPLLNTTAVNPVSIKMDLSWVGFDSDVMANNCSSDYIRVEYSVNGGAYTMIANVAGGNACATVSYPFVTPGTSTDGSVSINKGSITGGSTLKIRVKVFTNANAEIVTIDNVNVPEVGVALVILPIELVSFESHLKAKDLRLTWRTASESNNAGFDIERSEDGKDFRSIAWVVGNGTTKEIKDYYCDDKNLQEGKTYYYRLRQIDTEGKETLSKVISVSTKGNTKLKVYPSVTSGVLTIETTADIAKEESNTFQIHNLLGQQVLNGKATQSFDVSALPQGTYILKVGAEQVKFLKQ